MSLSFALARAASNAVSETSTAITSPRPALRGVESEAARVREAVEHGSVLRDARHGAPVELLVEEEARLLPVFNIHIVEYAVFAYARGALPFVRYALEPALFLREAFKLPQGEVVAFVHAAYPLPPRGERVREKPDRAWA